MFSAIARKGNLWCKSKQFASLIGQELTALQGGGPSFAGTPFLTVRKGVSANERPPLVLPVLEEVIYEAKANILDV
jgi:hypothetical protein